MNTNTTTLLIIDTETGGLDPSRHSILSLGAAVWRAGKIADDFEVFISEAETGIRAEAKALEINGIDLGWLRRNGAKPADAVALFHEFLGRHFDMDVPGLIDVGGHNVAFDVGFLDRLYRLAGLGRPHPFSRATTCTMTIFKRLRSQGKVHYATGMSLGAATDYFGIMVEPGERRHTARADAVATGRLLTKLREVMAGGS